MLNGFIIQYHDIYLLFFNARLQSERVKCQQKAGTARNDSVNTAYPLVILYLSLYDLLFLRKGLKDSVTKPQYQCLIFIHLGVRGKLHNALLTLK